VGEQIPPPPPATAAVTVTVRYFAAARAAARTTEELLTIPPGTGAGPPTVADVLQVAIDRHGAPLGQVLQRCSFLLDEIAVHGSHSAVRGGQVLDVLPPFAGG
jgi:molybdopterin synthase sulfur carrier subunit